MRKSNRRRLQHGRQVRRIVPGLERAGVANGAPGIVPEAFDEVAAALDREGVVAEDVGVSLAPVLDADVQGVFEGQGAVAIDGIVVERRQIDRCENPGVGRLVGRARGYAPDPAINLTDGLDGLAVGVCLLASSVNAVVAIWMGNHYMAVMMVLLAGSLLGFLRYNFHPARVFLGDTGSLALGMFLALASLRSAQKSHTAFLILVPLFALGYPIFDTLLAVGRRMVRGQPLFASDRDHIHHRLLDRGRSPSAAAIQIYIVSIVVSLVCIAAVTANHFVLGLGIAGVALMALFSARVLGYLEWGGWVARWSGREETKVLHLAADLARLKIRQAKDRAQLLRGLAIAAREMGCVRIVLLHGEETNTWDDPDRGDVAAGFEDATDSEDCVTVEMPLDEETKIRFTLSGGESLDAERSQLLEELSRELGEQL